MSWVVKSFMKFKHWELKMKTRRVSKKSEWDFRSTAWAHEKIWKYFHKFSSFIHFLRLHFLAPRSWFNLLRFYFLQNFFIIVGWCSLPPFSAPQNECLRDRKNFLWNLINRWDHPRLECCLASSYRLNQVKQTKSVDVMNAIKAKLSRHIIRLAPESSAYTLQTVEHNFPFFHVFLFSF